MTEVPFHPHPWLRNPHIMTILPGFARQHARQLDHQSQSVLVDVAPDSRVLIHKHINPTSKAPILIGLSAASLTDESEVYRITMGKQIIKLF